MNKMIMPIAALCLSLSACSNNTYTYVRQDGSNEALQDDLIECKAVMARQVGDDAKAAMDQCMAAKGYTKEVDKYRL